MRATKPLIFAAAAAAILVAIFIARSASSRVSPTAVAPALPSPVTPTAAKPVAVAVAPTLAEPQATPATPPPAKRPQLPAEAARLRELSPPILQQRFAAQQRIDAFAAAAGDFKEVIPAQAKRYQEPETVLTLIELLHDPNWSPMFSDYIQHRHGLEYTRQWLHVVETALGLDAGFSSARNATELRALLLRAEPQFRQRSDEIAAKFQLDETLAADAREVAMLDTLQMFAKAYRYWVINKNRDCSIGIDNKGEAGKQRE